VSASGGYERGSGVRIERIGALVLSALLLWSAAADADEREVRSHIEDYFRDFNEVRAPQYLADAYLSSPLTIVSSTGVRNLNSMEDVEGWLRQIQSTLQESGWLRSELLEARVCMTEENVAVFSMKLVRVGKDGRTALGATYTLFKSDRWRIATIMIASPDRLLSCNTPS